MIIWFPIKKVDYILEVWTFVPSVAAWLYKAQTTLSHTCLVWNIGRKVQPSQI